MIEDVEIGQEVVLVLISMKFREIWKVLLNLISTVKNETMITFWYIPPTPSNGRCVISKVALSGNSSLSLTSIGPANEANDEVDPVNSRQLKINEL